MRLYRRAPPPLTVFITILSLFIVVGLLVGTAVTLANYVGLRDAAAKVAADAFEAKIARINERRIAYFAPVYLMTALARDNAPVSIADTVARQRFQKLVLPGLTLNPQISGICRYDNDNPFRILSVTDHEKNFIADLAGPSATRFAVQDIHAEAGGARTETWRFSTKIIASSDRIARFARTMTHGRAAGIRTQRQNRKPSFAPRCIFSPPLARSA